jgi:tetratricopeptide (TPR) repeat protein
MDGRRVAGWFAVGLLSALGCGKTMPLEPGPIPPDAQITPAPSKVKELTPNTLVAMAGFREATALEAVKTTGERDALLLAAREAYAQAIQKDPHYLPAYSGLAQHWDTIGEHEQAITIYRLALQEAPNDPCMRFEFGKSLASHKEWPEAAEQLRQASALVPQNGTYGTYYALCLARAGQTDEALNQLLRFHAPAEAHCKLARTLKNVGQPELCRHQAQLALQADEKCQSALDLLNELDQPARAAASVPAP